MKTKETNKLTSALFALLLVASFQVKAGPDMPEGSCINCHENAKESSPVQNPVQFQKPTYSKPVYSHSTTSGNNFNNNDYYNLRNFESNRMNISDLINNPSSGNGSTNNLSDEEIKNVKDYVEGLNRQPANTGGPKQGDPVVGTYGDNDVYKADDGTFYMAGQNSDDGWAEVNEADVVFDKPEGDNSLFNKAAQCFDNFCNAVKDEFNNLADAATKNHPIFKACSDANADTTGFKCTGPGLADCEGPNGTLTTVNTDYCDKDGKFVYNPKEIAAARNSCIEKYGDSVADVKVNADNEVECLDSDGKKIGGGTLASNGMGFVEDEDPADPEREPAAEGTLWEQMQKFVAGVKGVLKSEYTNGEFPESLVFPTPTQNKNYASTDKNILAKCEMMLPDGTTWADVNKVVRNGGSDEDVAELFMPSYAKVYMDLRADLTAHKPGPEATEASYQNAKTSISVVLSRNMTDAYYHYQDLQKCHAMAFLTKYVDFSELNIAEGDDAPGSKKSFDGKIKATRAGAETQDYPACSRAINTYNAAFLGEQAMNIGQSFSYQETSMDATLKAQEDANTDITAGMKAQKTMTDKKSSIASARSAFHGAKGLTLWGMYEAIPTEKSIIADCNGKMGNGSAGAKHLARYIALIREQSHKILNIGTAAGDGIAIMGDGEDGGQRADAFVYEGEQATTTAPPCTATIATLCAPISVSVPWKVNTYQPTREVQYEKACKVTAQSEANNVGTGLINNETSCREPLFKAMMDAGVEMAANALKAKLLDDQSNLIGDAINNVKRFEDDNPPPTFEDASLEVCQVDPTAPECAQVDPVFDRAREFNSNGINITGGFNRATGGARNLGDASTDENVARDVDDKGGRGAGVKGIGTTVGAPTNSTGFIDGVPAAAGIKKGDGGGGGGGGGGGANPSAPGAGGGGGGSLGGGGGGKSAFGGNGRRFSFSGGGKGSLSFGGGRGGKGRSRGGSKGNPFSKFFKNKKGAKKGKTLNYRGVASVGGKKDSLFGMISNRYSKVKEERLIQYKAEEKK